MQPFKKNNKPREPFSLVLNGFNFCPVTAIPLVEKCSNFFVLIYNNRCSWNRESSPIKIFPCIFNMQSCLIIKILSVLFSNYVFLCPCTKRSIMYAFLNLNKLGFFKMTFEMSKGKNITNVPLIKTLLITSFYQQWYWYKDAWKVLGLLL